MPAEVFVAGADDQRGFTGIAVEVIFDRRPGLPPVEERLTASEETSPAGNRVTVIRA
jgi:hypothetical protein